jgi:two-component system, NarL family, response regulator NreC
MAIAVLLADDHGVLRDGVSRLLEAHEDISVIATASNGLDAISQAKTFRPDVVVMDIAMPQLNGIEATRSIIEHTRETGVVILSMHSSMDLIRQALAAGARGYLLKASVGDEVAAAVRAVAAGGLYLGQGVSIKGLDIHRTARHPALTLQDLSHAEREILRLVANGKSNAEAAQLLGLSPRTVETYRSRLMEKLQLDDLSALIKFAIRHGITSLD